MKFMRKQLDLLTRLALSENPKDQKKLREELKRMLANSHQPETVEATLTELGVPTNQVGYRYLTRAIQLQMGRPTPISFGKELWPTLAKEFNTTASAVEKGCRHAVETASQRVDMDIRDKYFGGTIDPNRGKPTLQHFITKVANVLREEE